MWDLWRKRFLRSALSVSAVSMSALGGAIVVAPLAAQTDQVARIIQTNSAGTNAHLIVCPTRTHTSC